MEKKKNWNPFKEFRDNNKVEEIFTMVKKDRVSQNIPIFLCYYVKLQIKRCTEYWSRVVYSR